ncbi:MAG: phosphonate ABC transporter substrate-binding protein [Methylococcales bacterium]|nr:phosphonate ABC transporter substrate-binding protein [Methylococcales bacterium]
MKLKILAVFALLWAAPTAQAKSLVMALIPAENNEQMVGQFEPMRQHLENKLGRSVKVYTATDYTGVIEAMRKKRVDIAWFGPLAYLLAEREAGAEAFAVGVRADTGKSTYRTVFVVPSDSPAQTLADLKGKNVAFVDPASASGGLVPTFMIKQATGLMPKAFFGHLTYAGSHDAAEMAVKNKTVDAAADNDITYRNMLNKGLISQGSNRILLESEPLPGAPMAFRAGLDAELKATIRDAILSAHEEIQVTGYGDLLRYEAASPDDYQGLRTMFDELGNGQ